MHFYESHPVIYESPIKSLKKPHFDIDPQLREACPNIEYTHDSYHVVTSGILHVLLQHKAFSKLTSLSMSMSRSSSLMSSEMLRLAAGGRLSCSFIKGRAVTGGNAIDDESSSYLVNITSEIWTNIT